jgi:hypothetical protein
MSDTMFDLEPHLVERTKTAREIRLEKLLMDAQKLIDARPNGYWARLEEMAVRIKQELAE